MKRTLAIGLSVCVLMSGLMLLPGCGGGTPVVVGELLPPATLPASSSSWLEHVTTNGTTTDSNTYYFDAANNLVAIKLTKPVGTTTQVNGMTTEVLSDLIVATQSVSLTKSTGTEQGVSYTVYFNAQITGGKLEKSGNNVTATYSVTYSNGESSMSTTATLTGTVAADGRTINFTRSKIVSNPAQTTDVERDVTLTWTLQSGNPLL